MLMFIEKALENVHHLKGFFDYKIKKTTLGVLKANKMALYNISEQGDKTMRINRIFFSLV